MVMRRILFAALVFVLGLGQALAADYNPLWMTSPQSDEHVSSSGPITVRWESLLGGDVDYTLVYSADGKTFSRVIAAKLRDAGEYAWTPTGVRDLFGWIKVKAYRQGYLLAESTVRVCFIPTTAVVVSKADQKVFYFVGGKLEDVFTCSTAMPKYDLGPGTYKVYLRQVNHWSKEYEVWMPHSLFFHEGYALHATTMIRQLGRPASHGCVRLHPRDAKTLYDKVAVGTPVIVLPKDRSCAELLPQPGQAAPDQRQAAAR